MALALHTTLLLMAVRIGSLPVAMHLVTNNPIERLAVHPHGATIVSTLSLTHWHRVHSSLRLVTNLKLIHQKS